LVSLNITFAFQGASASAATTISVATYGAKCDGTTDDTAAIQAALNATAAAGGGTVTLPGAICLLNSSNPSTHPWYFYNLQIPSGVTLQGTTGSKLLQGPNGQHARISGATEVRNTVLAVGNNYATIMFSHNPPGGFYRLNAIVTGTTSVTLATPAQAVNFAAGDYIAIYETNPTTSGCDVCAGQNVQLSGVNTSTGELTLADPAPRSFSAPSVAKVTSLAAHDVAVNSIIVQGAEPLAVTETFNFSASNNQFLSDTSVGSGNLYELQLNTVEHFAFTGNTIATINGPYISQELGQRDSQNG
jgi:polygalacturonase